MKKSLIAALISATALTLPAFAADVGVSVNIGQPGFYGRIDIGDFPAPQVIYQRPRAVEWVPVERPPIYLNVPPGHAKKWSKHCGRYNACGERVYFVQNNWYDREYVSHYQKRHGDRDDDRDDGHGKKHKKDKKDKKHGHGND